MSKYLLKLLGSDEIVNIIEWNGSGSLIAPSGYEFEPFVTESIHFINYFEEYTEETIAKLFGELDGKFSGELTGSITINGKTFEEIINETPYGELRATNIFDVSQISASNMFFVSGSTISLPKNNMRSERYTEFFENVIDNNIQNYKLTLNKTSDPNEKISYIISDTEIINDDGFEYIKLSINSENGYNVVATQSILNPSTPNNFFYRDEHSSHENYYVDFSLPTDLQVGNFYGDFRGEIGGEKLENVLGITPKGSDYAVFRFDETYWDSLDTFRGISGAIPDEGYFIFNQDSSVNGEYGESQWRNSNPTKIRIHMRPFDASIETDINFKNKLFEIVKNGYAGSRITLFQKMTNEFGVQAYKEFQIESMYYIERRLINNIPYYYEIQWGQKDFIETEDSLGFFSGIDDGTQTNPFFYSDRTRIGFFELTVKQTNPPISFVYTEAPVQDQEFRVSLDVKEIKKEITVFTESKKYTVPGWAKKITVYAVGAGGGGGAGSNGYGHHPGVGVELSKYWDYDQKKYIEEDYPRYKENGIERRFFFQDDFDEKIGHDVVLGGAGGAGGSVVVAEYEVGPSFASYPREAIQSRIDKLIDILQNIDNQLITLNDISVTPYIDIGKIQKLKIEREEYANELSKLQNELDDSYGIPPYTVLDVFVGAPGKGGNGRNVINDHPILLDMHKRDEQNNINVLGTLPTNKWKTLAFQREFLTVNQKNTALTLKVEIVPEGTQIDPLSRFLSIAGPILIGAVVTRFAGASESDTLENTITRYSARNMRNMKIDGGKLQWFEPIVEVGSVGNPMFPNTGFDMEVFYDKGILPKYLFTKWKETVAFDQWFKDMTKTVFNQPDVAQNLLQYGPAHVGGNIGIQFSNDFGKLFTYYGKDVVKYINVMNDYVDYRGQLLDWISKHKVKGLGSGMYGKGWWYQSPFPQKTYGTPTEILEYINSGDWSKNMEFFSTTYQLATSLFTIGGMIGTFVPIAGTLVNFAKHVFELATFDELIIEVPIPIVFNKYGITTIDDTWYNTIGTKLVPKGFVPLEPKYKLNYTYHTNRIDFDGFYNAGIYHSPDIQDYHGKHGGNSEIYMNGLCILKASGGIGGTGGYAYKALLNPIARLSNSNSYAYSRFIVPGGYGPTEYPFTKLAKVSKISHGGAGGYGIAAPTIDSYKYEDLLIKNKTFKIYENSKKLNVAPSTPITKTNYFTGMPNYGVYGKTSTKIESTTGIDFSKGSNNGVYQIDGNIEYPFRSGVVNRTKTELAINPTLLSTLKLDELIPTPPGGGGGHGVTWQMLDRRSYDDDPNFYELINSESTNNIIRIVFANAWSNKDPFKEQSVEIEKHLYLGLGGKVFYKDDTSPTYLFDEIDPNNGNRIRIEIKDGGNGGFGRYFATNGDTIFTNLQVENKPDANRITDLSYDYVLPQNVSDRWGSGGGGGAAHYETDWFERPNPGEIFYDSVQDGADGGPGIIIIVAES